MISKNLLGILAAVLISPSSSSLAQNNTVPLNGGLEATLLKVGRTKDHRYLTLSMRISNKGTNTAFLLLVNEPTATDNIGGIFNAFPVISGIAHCSYGSWASSYCLGIPKKVDWTVPLQSFTQIDPSSNPSAGIVVNFRLNGQGDGPAISFSADIYTRFVSDLAKDDTLPDAEKYKQFRLTTLSFPPVRVTDAP
jgi:hypothetical protein